MKPPENTHCRGKYYCMDGLWFDMFIFSSFATYKYEYILLFGSIQFNGNGDRETSQNEAGINEYTLA